MISRLKELEEELNAISITLLELPITPAANLLRDNLSKRVSEIILELEVLREEIELLM